MSWTPKTFVPDDESDKSKEWTPKSFVSDDDDDNRGILETIGNALAPGLGSMGKAVAENPTQIIPDIKTLAKSVPKAAADILAGVISMIGAPLISDVANTAAENVTTPSPEASNALELASSVIPAARAAEVIPDIAKLGYQGAKFLANKSGDISGISHLIGRNIGKAQQKLEDSASSIMKDLFGKNTETPADTLNKSADNVLSKLYGTTDYKSKIGTENQDLSQAVSNLYKKNYEEGSNKFEQIFKNNNPVINKEDAFIGKGEGKDLQKLMETDSGLADKIIEANNNPTLRNLHNIQSKMGDMIAQGKSVPYSQRDNATLNLLSDYRKKIIDNISNHAPDYKEAQQNWFKNVIPFHENAAINKLVRKGIQPANISNILSRPELPNAKIAPVNTILSQLSPLDKQKIVTSKLSGSLSKPLMDLSGNIDAESLAKKVSGLQSKNLSKFIPKYTKQDLISLTENLKNSNLHSQITKNVVDNSGQIHPEELLNNIKNIDLSKVDIARKSTIENAFRSLTDLAKNLEKQQKLTSTARKYTGIGGALGLSSALGLHHFRE